MNIDTLAGKATDLKGQVKESLGRATGDTQLEADGASDQVSGTVRKAFGDLRDFIKAQPALALVAAAALGAVLFYGRRGVAAR